MSPYLYLLKVPCLPKVLSIPVVHKLPWIQSIYDKFCTTHEKLPIAIQELRKQKYQIILDYAMEHNKAHSKKTYDTIMYNIKYIQKDDVLAIKPSALELNDLEKIIQVCHDKKQKVFIDAEEYHHYREIHSYIRDLQLKYNIDYPLIYHTYQCYLKSTEKRLDTDIEIFKKHQRILGIKLVRGAYLEFERNNAKNNNQDSPVYDNIHQTNVSYNRNLIKCIMASKQNRCALNIATHNSKSLEIAKKYINPKDAPYTFSQLKGMADNESNKLVEKGYRVYKYLPYGDYNLMIPYLIRRLNESYVKI
jgi:proline dehydrogenase